MTKFVGFTEIYKLNYCFSGKMHKIITSICKIKCEL